MAQESFRLQAIAMNELDTILSGATAEIGGGYFHLNIDGGISVSRAVSSGPDGVLV